MSRIERADERIPRIWLVVLQKILAEACAEEVKINLGWLYDLRRLKVSLPENKAIAWSEATDKMLREKKADTETLRSNIGSYVNIGMMLPYIHHILGRLRDSHRPSNPRRPEAHEIIHKVSKDRGRHEYNGIPLPR